MQYRVLVENPRPKLFLASVLELPGCTVQGSTEAEAVAAAQTALEKRLSTGKLVTFDNTFVKSGGTG